MSPVVDCLGFCALFASGGMVLGWIAGWLTAQHNHVDPLLVPPTLPIMAGERYWLNGRPVEVLGVDDEVRFRRAGAPTMEPITRLPLEFFRTVALREETERERRRRLLGPRPTKPPPMRPPPEYRRS